MYDGIGNLRSLHRSDMVHSMCAHHVKRGARDTLTVFI